MKRIFAVIAILTVFCRIALAEFAVKKEITAAIGADDNGATGLYTGEINKDGLPEGYGVLEAETNGEKWKYVGDWKNGQMEGEGWKVYENGMMHIGTFLRGYAIKCDAYQAADKKRHFDYTDRITVGDAKAYKTIIYYQKTDRNADFMPEFDGYVIPLNDETDQFYKGTRYYKNGKIDCTGYFNGYQPEE